MAFSPEHHQTDQNLQFLPLGPQGEDEHPRLFYMGVTSLSPPPGEARIVND